MASGPPEGLGGPGVLQRLDEHPPVGLMSPQATVAGAISHTAPTSGHKASTGSTLHAAETGGPRERLVHTELLCCERGPCVGISPGAERGESAACD